MKEAIGELNTTVIVVTIIAILSLFFFSYLWPKIRGDFTGDVKCDMAICPNDPHDGLVECYYRDKSGNEHKITCAWKG